jgi:hypothetical protein
MNDPNQPDAFVVRLQPTRRTTYWDRCNSLHAGAIYERRIVQHLWKEALDDYDEYADLVGLLKSAGFDENDPTLLDVMIVLDEIDDFIIYCEDIDEVHGLGFRVPRVIPVKTHRSLNTMDDRWAYANLRFSVPELRQIFLALQLDDTIRPGNRYVFNAEEAFIITLFRMTTGMPFTKMAEDIFGQDARRLSFIYNYMIRKYDDMCDGVLHGDSVTRWVPHFESWAALFQRVCEEKYKVQLNGAIRIAMLMDCNAKETMTPGTGPMTDIPGAPRFPDADVLQGAVYSGYMKYHGIKAQILTAPTECCPGR